MSTLNSAPQNVRERSVKSNLDIDQKSDIRMSVVSNIEVASLQIDERYEVDCDPYNCTGQTLVRGKKAK